MRGKAMENFNSKINKKKNQNESHKPIQTLLLNEHNMVLRSYLPTRLLNRFLIVLILALPIFIKFENVYLIFSIILIGLFITINWYFSEISTKRYLNHIEKLIVQTNTDQDDDAWLQTYINWRSDKENVSIKSKIDIFEPLIWSQCLGSSIYNYLQLPV